MPSERVGTRCLVSRFVLYFLFSNLVLLATSNTMPFKRLIRREYRSRAVEWAIIYTLYLFVALGLIVSSSITIKYGNDFFNDPATNTASATGANGAAGTGAQDGEADPEATAEAQQLAQNRRDALIHSGVMGSIGLASVC